MPDAGFQMSVNRFLSWLTGGRVDLVSGIWNLVGGWGDATLIRHGRNAESQQRPADLPEDLRLAAHRSRASGIVAEANQPVQSGSGVLGRLRGTGR
jgi:hypothetical protein